MKQVSVEANLRHEHPPPMSIDVGRKIATSRASMGTKVPRSLQPGRERLQGRHAMAAVSGCSGRAPVRFVEHGTDPRRRATLSPGRDELVLASPDAIREHWGRGSFLSGARPAGRAVERWRLGASDRSCAGGIAGFHAAAMQVFCGSSLLVGDGQAWGAWCGWTGEAGVLRP